MCAVLRIRIWLEACFDRAPNDCEYVLATKTDQRAWDHDIPCKVFQSLAIVPLMTSNRIRVILFGLGRLMCNTNMVDSETYQEASQWLSGLE